MNTVGKPGKLGEQVRCVVSRLDAHRGLGRQHGHPHPRRPRVRHPAPLRAGRRPRPAPPLVRRQRRRAASSPSTPSLRRPVRSSSPPTSRSTDPPPPKPVDRGPRRSTGARTCGSTFPKLDGYRVELPDERASGSTSTTRPSSTIGPNTVPTLGRDRRRRRRARARRRATRRSTARSRSRSRSPSASSTRNFTHRRRQAALAVPAAGRDRASEWLEQRVVVDRRLQPRATCMTITEARVLAAEAVWNAIVRQDGNRRERLRPMIHRFDPVGSTGDVDFHDPQAHRADARSPRSPTSPSTARTATPGSSSSRASSS